MITEGTEGPGIGISEYHSCIRILKYPDGGFFAVFRLPGHYMQLYGRSCRRLKRNVIDELRTYLEGHPSPGKIEIKSEPTRIEELYDKICSPSEKELARIRKALSKRVPEITFS